VSAASPLATLQDGATQRVKRVRITGDPVTIKAAFARRMGAP
jgi:hypothetical protein